MLDSKRNLKLVDFGLAQTFDHDAISEADHPLFCQLRKVGGDVFPLLWATDHNPHQTNLANGTEGYAPPEVWKCQMHSFGIDYFAMGCALHMLITGNVEYLSPTPLAYTDVLRSRQAPFGFDQTTQDYKYDNICVDKNMDLDAYDFLLKVLAPRPLHRLNLRRMKMHPVFRTMSVPLCHFPGGQILLTGVPSVIGLHFLPERLKLLVLAGFEVEYVMLDFVHMDIAKGRWLTVSICMMLCI